MINIHITLQRQVQSLKEFTCKSKDDHINLFHNKPVRIMTFTEYIQLLTLDAFNRHSAESCFISLLAHKELFFLQGSHYQFTPYSMSIMQVVGVCIWSVQLKPNRTIQTAKTRILLNIQLETELPKILKTKSKLRFRFDFDWIYLCKFLIRKNILVFRNILRKQNIVLSFIISIQYKG